MGNDAPVDALLVTREGRAEVARSRCRYRGLLFVSSIGCHRSSPKWLAAWARSDLPTSRACQSLDGKKPRGRLPTVSRQR
jgi:hypothetical protein